jgi:hypothetical protein
LRWRSDLSKVPAPGRPLANLYAGEVDNGKRVQKFSRK